MPFDSKGKHHLNTQKMMAAEKMPPPKPPKPPMAGGGVGDPMAGKNENDMGGDSTRTMISHNDDGSHMVDHADGEQTGPHDTIEDALDAIHQKHGGAMPPHGMHEGAAPRHGMPMHEGHAMMSGM